MKDNLKQVTSDTFVDMINQLANVSPLVGEKTIHQEPGMSVRATDGESYLLPYWDVIKRADDTYWSPLDGDRKTIYDVTTFEVQTQETGEWVKMAVWFGMDKI